MIYDICHIWTAEMKWKWRNDCRSERNLCNCVKKPEKKFRTSTTSPLHSKTNHKSSKNHPECYICYSKFSIAWEFEISLVVFIPNIITNHAITYTNSRRFLYPGQEPHCTRQLHITCIKTESNRKLSNFNFHWTKTLYQNNLNNIAFFFTFFKGYRCN